MRTEYKACPLCGSSFRADRSADIRQHSLWHPGLPESILWVRCNSCNHSFTAHYWDEEGLKEVFKSAHSFQTPGEALEIGRYVMAEIVSRHIDFAEPPWLDVGFGSGSFLTTVQEFGIECYGIDTRAKAVIELSKLGRFNILQSSFQDYSPLDSLGAIFMLDVLEHMPFPGDALLRAHAMLKEDGVLVLSMPNIDAPIWKILDPNPYWFEFEHHHNFGRARLYALLKEYKFTPLFYNVSKRYRACMEITAARKT